MWHKNEWKIKGKLCLFVCLCLDVCTWKFSTLSYLRSAHCTQAKKNTVNSLCLCVRLHVARVCSVYKLSAFQQDWTNKLEESFLHFAVLESALVYLKHIFVHPFPSCANAAFVSYLFWLETVCLCLFAQVNCHWMSLFLPIFNSIFTLAECRICAHQI